MKKNKLFILAAVSLTAILGAVIFIPCPTDAQYVVFRIILSLGVAGIGAVIPGFFMFRYRPFVMAGGAMGLFAFTFLFTPRLLNNTGKCEDTFQLTIFVHGEDGPNDLVLKGKRQVVLDLEGDRRFERINETGEAFFPGIPSKFHNIPVHINILPEHNIVYTAADSNGIIIGYNKAFYLKVIPKGLNRISGFVRDTNNLPISGVTVSVQGIYDTTDLMGRFVLSIPGEQQRIEQRLTAVKKGYQVYDITVYPATDKDVEIILR